MKKWTVVGILGISLFAICLGSLVALIPVLGRFVSGGMQWNVFSIHSINAEAVEEQRAAVDGPADLTVDTPFGNVEVTAQESSTEIVISAHKNAWGASQKAAEELLEKTNVVVEQTGNAVTVYVDQPVELSIFRIGPMGISVDFTITVPPDCSVDASSSSGEVYLEGIQGDAVLFSSFGEVTAENITGGLRAGTSSGDVVVKNIQAPGHSVEASTSFGEVLVQHAQGDDLTAKSSSGNVTVEESAFTWNADMSSSFGDIKVIAVTARSINAQTSSGEVRLQGLTVENDLTARSDFGDVDVADTVAGSFALNTNSGEVTAIGVQGKVKAHSGFGDITVSGTDAVLDLSTNSGSIEFTGTLGEGTSVLDTNFGDIRIELPADAEFTADLSTDFGDIRCGFPITSERSSSSHLVGTVGAGGPTLKASTNSGNIELYPQEAG
ncbi:MAG: DUF4097 family beta strand repeat-containing protein [Anaerolineales bacterium]